MSLTRREVQLLRRMEEARDHHVWARRLVVAWCLAAAVWLSVIVALIAITVITAGSYDMAGWNFFGFFLALPAGGGIAFLGIEVAWPAFFDARDELRQARYAHEDALLEAS